MPRVMRYAVCIHSVSHIQFRLSVFGGSFSGQHMSCYKERFAIASFISNKCMMRVGLERHNIDCRNICCFFICTLLLLTKQ